MYRAARRLGVLFGAAMLLVLQTPALGPLPRAGFELDLAAPGVAELELRGVFGEPLAVEQDPASKTWREDFARPDAGFARVTVWLDRQERVTCARVLPVRPLRLAAAELLFDLRGASTRSGGHLFSGVEPGFTQSFPKEGVHFFLAGDRVEEIWRTVPGIDVAALGGELGVVYPPADLPEPERELEPGTDPVLEGPDMPLLGGSAAPELEITNGLLRGLAVTGLDVTFEIDDNFNPVLVANAQVSAEGLANEAIRFEAYLRPLDLGTDVPARLGAAARAPAEFRDASGGFHVTGNTTVLYDSASFGAIALRMPLAYLADYHGNFSGEFLATFEVTCAGLAAVDAAVCAVPGPNSTPGFALPVVRAASVLVVPDEHETMGPGVWILRDVDALNLREQTIWSVATLRRPSGEVLGAAEGWDGWRSSDGAYYAAASDTVLYDTSNWKPFRVFVAFRPLALEPGVHRVVLRSQVSVSNLGGANELELDLTIPELSR